MIQEPDTAPASTPATEKRRPWWAAKRMSVREAVAYVAVVIAMALFIRGDPGVRLAMVVGMVVYVTSHQVHEESLTWAIISAAAGLFTVACLIQLFFPSLNLIHF